MIHGKDIGWKNMKTLDEVIFEAPYSPTDWAKDALYHLKKYKRVQNKIEKIALGNIEDTLDKLDNKPLTWNELKQMEGKPVWVEWISGCWKGSKKWILSHGCDDLMMVFTALDVAKVSYDGHLRKISLGKTWQAYRKEKKNDYR